MTTPQNESLQAIKEYADDYDLDLSWLDTRGEWGIKAAPDPKRGMTLSSIEIGSYGEAPDTTDNMTGRPRGAAQRPDAYRIGGYGVRTKSEIWLDNAAALYEESLQRQ